MSQEAQGSLKRAVWPAELSGLWTKTSGNPWKKALPMPCGIKLLIYIGVLVALGIHLVEYI